MFQTLFLFLIGIIFGSFFNVLILRYNPEKAIFGKQLQGRSACLYCKQKLNWYELIPVFSFLIQRGKCRKCASRISLQYPIVEILSGLIVVTVPMVLGFNYLALIWILVLFTLLIASCIDIRHYVIPDELNLIIFLLGALATIIISINHNDISFMIPGTFLGTYAYIFSFTTNIWILRLSAFLFGGIFFTSIILLSREKAMGWGDAKLAAAAGLLIGWPDIIMALMLAFIIGAIVGVIAMLLKKKGRKDMLPFGPFIAIGIVIVFYFGQNLISAYFNFLNSLVY